MRPSTSFLIVLAFASGIASSTLADDSAASGFHRLGDYIAAGAPVTGHENIDDLFDTVNATLRLATAKRVRLFRKPANPDFVNGP